VSNRFRLWADAAFGDRTLPCGSLAGLLSTIMADGHELQVIGDALRQWREYLCIQVDACVAEPLVCPCKAERHNPYVSEQQQLAFTTLGLARLKNSKPAA
jgi:hypothetical protein